MHELNSESMIHSSSYIFLIAPATRASKVNPRQGTFVAEKHSFPFIHSFVLSFVCSFGSLIDSRCHEMRDAREHWWCHECAFSVNHEPLRARWTATRFTRQVI